MNQNNYSANGITLSPTIPTLNDQLTITYTGLLAENSADCMYIHLGYSIDGENWTDVSDIQMDMPNSGTFEIKFPVKDKSTVNFAFRDGAGNWDNNCGNNYSFKVYERPSW